jgi:hydroxymethylglutaryl-CoA reductase (NADPH)
VASHAEEAGPWPVTSHPEEAGAWPVATHREEAGAWPVASHPEEAGAWPVATHREEAGAWPVASHREEAGAWPVASHPEEAGAWPVASHPEEAGAKRPATEGSLSRQGSSPTALLSSLTSSLDTWLTDHSLRIESVALDAIETDDSIVAELTACRAGRANRAGLYSATLAVVGPNDSRHEINVFVKSKTSDHDVIDVAQGVAALASPALGQSVAQFSGHLGFTRCHVRELALYSHPDPRLRRHMPEVLAVHRDDDAHEWMVALESIEDAHLMNAADGCTQWTDEAIEAAIVGLARIHAVGFERRDEFAAANWSAPRRDAHQRVAMTPLWSALATHARERSPAWNDPVLCIAHEQLVKDVGSWSRALDVSPQTLIHNDFNSRNIAIRGKPGELRLCAFDWELATMGVPQRDLAELLCFVLPTDAPPTTIAHWLERHRALLERETDLTFRPDAWDIGFRAALCDLLVDRFASYAMVDRIRRQSYLARVVRSWTNVYQHYPWIPVASSSG